MDWLPIESAPRDGTRVVLFDPRGGVCLGYFVDTERFSYGKSQGRHQHWAVDGWISLAASPPEPTHWVALPPAPDATPSVYETATREVSE